MRTQYVSRLFARALCVVATSSVAVIGTLAQAAPTQPVSVLPPGAVTSSQDFGPAPTRVAVPTPDQVDPAAAAQPVAGVRNFRDVVEPTMRTVDGQSLRQGVFFRSAALNEITDEGLRALSARHVSTIIDLRTVVEQNLAPDRVPGWAIHVVEDIADPSFGVTVDPLAVGGGVSSAPDGSSAGAGVERSSQVHPMQVLYPLMVTNESSRHQFADTLRTLAGAEGAALFHCTEGKDRTGLTAAFILRIAGVPVDQINASFLASNAALGDDQAVDIAWIQAAWNAIDTAYSDFDTYVRDGLGLSEETVAALRHKVIG